MLLQLWRYVAYDCLEVLTRALMVLQPSADFNKCVYVKQGLGDAWRRYVYSWTNTVIAKYTGMVLLPAPQAP
jgi:hypothetical protein